LLWKLALAFAHKILLWDNAEISSNMADWYIVRAEANKNSQDVQCIFSFAQADVVMELVRAWCDENRHQFRVAYKDKLYAVDIRPNDSEEVSHCGPEQGP
jgi:hypothetical protein